MLNLFSSIFKHFQQARHNKGRFLAYFITVNLLVAGTIGTLLYVRMSKTTEQQTIEANQNMLLLINKSTDILLNQIERYMDLIAIDPDITSIPELYKSNDKLSILKVNDKIEKITVANNYIYDMDIYYPEEGKVFQVNNGFFNLDEFIYKAIIKAADRYPSSIKMVPATKIKDKSNPERFINIISIIKPIPMNGAKPEAYAFINIEEGFFRNIFNSLTDSRGLEIYIANNNGDIISQNIGKGRFARFMKTSFLGNLSKDGPEYIVDEYDNEKVLVSAVMSKMYGWKFVSVLPYNSMDEKIRFIKYYSIAVSMLAIILGIFASLFFSDRISQPINSITRLFKNSDGISGETDVFKYIEKNVNRLVEKKESIEKTLADHMPVLRNNFLNDILLGNIMDRMEIEDRFGYYGINLEVDGNYLVYVISISNYVNMSSHYSERQINMLTIYLMGVIEDFINSENQGIVINSRPGELAIILKLTEDTDNVRMKQKIAVLGMDIQKNILEKASCKASIAVGSTYKEIGQVFLSYEEALEALRYRDFAAKDSVIFYENIKSMKEESYSYPFHKVDDLLNSLRQGKLGEVFECNKEIFKTFDSNYRENNKYMVYYIQLLSSTIRFIYETGLDMGEGFDESKLYNEILGCQDTFAVKTWFERLFKRISEVIESKKVSKNRSIIEKIENYICCNFDKDLSLTALAEVVYMSPDYFRKVFKEETGKSVKQYINEIRAVKAKEFLRNPKYKISEVAEMIGYDKVNAFLYFFKESTGMNPGEYRSSVVLDKGDTF